MMRSNWKFLFFLMLVISVVSCTEDEAPPPVQSCVQNTFAPGIFITNEGPFSNGSGTITYFNPTDKTSTNKGYQTNNCDEEIGSIVQSIYVHQGKAYIVVNNSNKIIIADPSTLEKEAEITGLELPRYFLPVGTDRAFVSQWGADGITGSVAVLNLTSQTIETTIPCGSGPENMIQVGNKVYVANVGGYDRDNRVTVIDVNSESVLSTFEVGDNPQSFAVDNVGGLWCLSKGFTDFNDPSNSTPGRLSAIENDQEAKQFTAAGGASWLSINNAGDEMIYLAPGGIYKTVVSNPSLEPSNIITGNFYAMAIDFNTNQIYASDAVDFASDGIIYRYEMDGTLIDSFEAGIIPGGFWFE